MPKCDFDKVALHMGVLLHIFRTLFPRNTSACVLNIYHHNFFSILLVDTNNQIFSFSSLCLTMIFPYSHKKIRATYPIAISISI